jgi:hypothetical protein
MSLWKPDEPADPIEVALRIGGRIVHAVVALVVAIVGFGVGGAAWVTKVNAQLSQVVDDVSRIDENLRSLSERFTPAPYIDAAHRDMKREQRRLQVQIDAINAAALGRPFDRRGYNGLDDENGG